MSEDKRFTETISMGVVTDNETGKEYDLTNSNEMLDLLNKLYEDNIRLNKIIDDFQRHCNCMAELNYESEKKLYEENQQVKADLKTVLPVLLAIDFKISINECEAINRLCEFIDDDFVVGADCEKE